MRCFFCRVVCVCVDWTIDSGSSSAGIVEAVFYLVLDVLVLKRFAVPSKATSPRKHLALQAC